jgi:FkbM family methyltransferase
VVVAQVLSKLLTPYTRRELPGWGRLLGLTGGYSQHAWRSAGTARVRGKWHGYLMTLDLADASDRLAYFIGRYHDLPSQLLIRHMVRRGETFVDIGANTGMMTLLGAGLVGPEGRVYSFEPNPGMFARVKSDVDLNEARHVSLHQVGLGDQPGELVLRVLASNDCLGTFALVDGKGDLPITAEHRVRVIRGDEVLAGAPATPMAIKIDVEGFECRVLRGLEQTLASRRPMVMTESLPWILARAGSSIGELFDIMHGHGYEGYELRKERRSLRYQLSIAQVPSAEGVQASDMAWVHPDSPHADRVKGILNR